MTRTPLVATALTSALVLLLALLLPLQHLADLTARLTLVVFALVNLSLIRIKARERPREGHVPAGFVSCVALRGADGLIESRIASHWITCP